MSADDTVPELPREPYRPWTPRTRAERTITPPRAGGKDRNAINSRGPIILPKASP